MNTTQIVSAALQHVTFGPLSEYNGLGVVPLFAPGDRPASYSTLDEAMAQHRLTVTEVTADGHVPELKVENSGETPVLIVDGEELVGAKQNRVVNLTLLIPAHKTMVIPVSCVESGRWQHTSRAFSSSARVHFAEGRARKMQNVTASLRHGNSRRSNQREVWDIIAGKASRLEASSATSAMSSIYEAHEEPINHFVEALPPVDRQVGAVYFVHGRVAGLELFDSAATWRQISPKLTRSYAVDAIDRDPRRGCGASAPRADAQPAAQAFRDALVSSPSSSFPATGAGEDVRLTGLHVVGAALVADERAVHISGFPMTDEARQPARQ